MTTVAPTRPVLRARELAGALIRPLAEQVDRTVVPRSHLAAWGAAGLLGLAGPTEYGGAAAPAQVVREVTEELAGACGATWFVAAQHATPLATLSTSTNGPLRGRLLRDLCTGEVLAGVAVAQLRRPGPPAVTATRTENGWRFDGHVGWMTGWGLCEVFLLGAVSPAGEVVTALVPARKRSGLTASAPMELAAMQATLTVTLDLDGYAVSDRDVVAVQDATSWLAADAAKTANPSPQAFGLQRECLRRLAETAARRNDGTAAALAHQLGQEGHRLRTLAYALIDDVPAAERVEDRLAVRAASLELAVRTATALVTATGGSAMALSAAPQRLLREAAFLLVQAQTGPVREATLQLFRESGP